MLCHLSAHTYKNETDAMAITCTEAKLIKNTYITVSIVFNLSLVVHWSARQP